MVEGRLRAREIIYFHNGNILVDSGVYLYIEERQQTKTDTTKYSLLVESESKMSKLNECILA